MENNITEYLEYDDIQELRNNAGREINEDCRTICDYVESYLGGTAHFDGADYIGTTQSEDLVYKRYKLLDDTVNKCRLKLERWGLEDKLYEQIFQVCYPYIKQLFDLYSIAKKEYEIYSQVEGYSPQSVSEITTTNTNPQKNVTTSKYTSLTEFINGGTEKISYMLEHKQPKDGLKLKWMKAKRDVFLLVDVLHFTVADINKCLHFKGGKKLTSSNRTHNNENPKLRSILEQLK